MKELGISLRLKENVLSKCRFAIVFNINVGHTLYDMYRTYRTPFVLVILIAFLMNSFGAVPLAHAQEFHLPAPGVMVHLSPPLNPPILKGIKVHPDNPFQFDFILDKGDSALSNDHLKEESSKLIKYFLASLTIPEQDLWVNLSPYEKDRIVPESFGQTEMGRDLLAEDYMLKQITASLIYPEDSVGRKFWKRIYEEAQKKYGTTNIPVNTFNKVWIVPEKAVVLENAKVGAAYVTESKLKVMLEEDYLSLDKHEGIQSEPQKKQTNELGSQIVREVVIPELTTEINENKNFAQLRQVYNSLILAAWYKRKIKDSILSQVYTDKNKVAGVNIDDPNEKQKIFQQYLKAFKKGVYNYIKEDVDPATQATIPRKYFSGGAVFDGPRIDGALNVTGITNKSILPDTSNELDLGILIQEPAVVRRDGAMVATSNPVADTSQKNLSDDQKRTVEVSVAKLFDYWKNLKADFDTIQKDPSGVKREKAKRVLKLLEAVLDDEPILLTVPEIEASANHVELALGARGDKTFNLFDLQEKVKNYTDENPNNTVLLAYMSVYASVFDELFNNFYKKPQLNNDNFADPNGQVVNRILELNEVLDKYQKDHDFNKFFSWYKGNFNKLLSFVYRNENLMFRTQFFEMMKHVLLQNPEECVRLFPILSARKANPESRTQAIELIESNMKDWKKEEEELNKEIKSSLNWTYQEAIERLLSALYLNYSDNDLNMFRGILKSLNGMDVFPQIVTFLDSLSSKEQGLKWFVVKRFEFNLLFLRKLAEEEKVSLDLRLWAASRFTARAGGVLPFLNTVNVDSILDETAQMGQPEIKHMISTGFVREELIVKTLAVFIKWHRSRIGRELGVDKDFFNKTIRGIGKLSFLITGSVRNNANANWEFGIEFLSSMDGESLMMVQIHELMHTFLISEFKFLHYESKTRLKDINNAAIHEFVADLCAEAFASEMNWKSRVLRKRLDFERLYDLVTRSGNYGYEEHVIARAQKAAIEKALGSRYSSEELLRLSLDLIMLNGERIDFTFFIRSLLSKLGLNAKNLPLRSRGAGLTRDRVLVFLENDIRQADKALISSPDSDLLKKGGIDFGSDKINLETRNQGGEIKFHLNPAQLAQLQNVPGFTPVIISIQPMVSLRIFLGLSDLPQKALVG
ncbi:MAG: hypothetical protein HQL15_01865 [Candidatus Omnitrophica bacterium]|nr:hypothetical protein [Candidatus Omnitrophota bacterium]